MRAVGTKSKHSRGGNAKSAITLRRRGIEKKRPQPDLSLPERIEQVLIVGDLSPLAPQERVLYYHKVCKSLNLNPLTSPFTYILFREPGGGDKLQLYANKSCAEQLRKMHGVSVLASRKEIANDICMYEVDVRDRTGRVDSAAGAVPLYKFKDGKRIDFIGVEWCNAVMKSHTKAKRRATLSICGLAFLDESELDTMQVVGGVTPDGRIYRYGGGADDEHEPHREQQAIAEKKIAELKEKVETNKAAPEKPKPPKLAWTKTMPDGDVAVSGYLADEAMKKFLADVSAVRLKSANDGGTYWRFAPNYLEGFKTLCKQLGVDIQ